MQCGAVAAVAGNSGELNEAALGVEPTLRAARLNV